MSLMVLFCYAIHAQSLVIGKVTDNENHPLAGASVYIPEMNKGTSTDAEGNYKLQNLPDGRIRIQYSFIGYASHIETVGLVNETHELNVVLKPTSIEAEEIVVSGGYSATQHENAVKIDILKLQTGEVKNTPNMTEKLTEVPGVDMISKGSGVSKPVIRGLSMNDILVLNNGVRFENYQYSSHHPLGIDEFGVEDVEIIKGPASLLYGSDAIGGVVNFIKEKPAAVGTVAGDYNLQMYSNTLGLTNNIGIKGASKNVFGGIRFGQKTNADFLQGGGEYAPNTRFNETSAKANLGITGKIGTFDLFYDVSSQKLGLAEDEAIEAISERGRKNEIWYQQFKTHLVSSQNKLYLGRFKLGLNSAFQSTELVHFGEPGVYELQMRLSTLTYEAKLHLPSKLGSEYIIGFQGFNQKNTNLNDRETILLPDATTTNSSLFGLMQFTFFKKMRLQAGARYDYKTISADARPISPEEYSYMAPLDRHYGSFSGSAGATWNFSETLLLRFNFAAAYRTPNLAELTSDGPHELRYELGNRDLVPENAYETDLNLHYHRENVTFDVAGFYNNVNHYIFITPTGQTAPSGLEVYAYQQANSMLFGGEAGLHIHPKQFKWLHFKSTFATVTGKKKEGEFLPFIPANKLRFEIQAMKEELLFLKKVYAGFIVTSAFNQNHVAPEETTTDGYTLIDFSAGGNFKIGSQQVLCSLYIDNLFDKKYVDHLSTLKEVNLLNPGRNISINLRVPF
jgi:iron complex outermembrane receptor protein